MATVTSTITYDTGEFVYIDSFGSPHTVTNGQTMSLTIDDNGAADVRYYVATAQSITTTDGYKIVFRPDCRTSNSDSMNRKIAPLTDAGQGSDFYSLRGEFVIDCPVSFRRQIWKPAKINPSDADYGAAGTITMTLEDQWGHVMVIPAPAVGGSVTVGQAS